MELTEPIDDINKQLVDLFGIDTSTGDPIYRIVWSETQFEKRLMNMTDMGVLLARPEVRLVPKYRQWIQNKYVLERLVVVPEQNIEELAGLKLSYEPLWVFQNSEGEALPPTLWAAKFCVDTVHAVLGKKSLARYIDEEAKNPVESKEKRIAQLTEELFGDESFLIGRTVTGEAVAMPPNYERES